MRSAIAHTWTRTAAVVSLALVAAGCGGSGGDDAANGGPTLHSVGVDVRGFADSGLVLLNNGGDALPIPGDGRHAFRTSSAAGQPFAVSVQQQPFAQVCAVANGTGTIDAAGPPVVSVDCYPRVVAAAGLFITTQLGAAGLEQFLYARSRTHALSHFRIRSNDGGLDAAGPNWSPFAASASTSFLLSPDGRTAYADDLLGQIRAASLRDVDGVIVPSWSGMLGQYAPALPIPFAPVRLSPDGRALYRHVSAVIGGLRYLDLWVGTVDAAGVTVADGSPFPVGSSSGGPHFDPTGRFFARAANDAGVIEVYRALSSVTDSPQLVSSSPVSFDALGSYSLRSEPWPSGLLFETRAVTATGAAVLQRPDLAVHRWRQDGSLETLGAPLIGAFPTGEIASEVCVNGETVTRRIATLNVLPATAAGHRVVVQRQDSYCRSLLGAFGDIVDSRVLGLYLLRIVNDQTSLTRLPVDALTGYADLGTHGVMHPREPWLYVGSKFSQRVYGFEIDVATGAVESLPGSPFDGATSTAPSGVMVPSMIVDPTGKYLYMGRFPSSQPHFVHAFTIDQATGSLAAQATYPLP